MNIKLEKSSARQTFAFFVIIKLFKLKSRISNTKNHSKYRAICRYLMYFILKLGNKFCFFFCKIECVCSARNLLGQVQHLGRFLWNSSTINTKRVKVVNRTITRLSLIKILTRLPLARDS